MEHAFNVNVAIDVGIEEAVILKNISFWIEENAANKRNIHDGKVWTFNSVSAYKELFPYMSERQIGYALNNLVKHGLLQTGCYNQKKYDRTKWYTLTEKSLVTLGITHFTFLSEDITKLSNGSDKIVEPIPDVNTDINANEKPFIGCSAHNQVVGDTLFDIDILKTQIANHYHKGYGTDVPLDEIFSIVDYFMDSYKRCMNIEHPKLSNETVVEILHYLSSCESSCGQQFDLTSADEYEPLIDYYFTQDFKGNAHGECDYSLARFILSADIRANCCFKSGYY
jgi:hypothetical protein